jgi:peptidoglycan/LPS O-acetylase OafA/YrhL
VSRDRSRVFGLDVLRAFAILCVVYEHGYGLLHHAISRQSYFLPVFDGVTIFFVLSGFLIGRILLRTMAKDDLSGGMMLEFWVRRWCRTLPNYLLILSLLVVAAQLSGEPQAGGLTSYFLFSQNIAAPPPDFFPESWSLSVEEWFYLLLPITLYLSRKLGLFDRRRQALLWIVAIIIAVTALRIYRTHHFGYASHDDWDSALRKQVVTRLDSLMFGVLGAHLCLYHADKWHRSANAAFIAGIALLLFDKAFYLHTQSMLYLNYFSLTLTAVGTLLLLPRLSALRRDGGWVVRGITCISLISYSMYLLNYTPVQQFILPLVMRHVMEVLWRFNDYTLLIKYTIYWLLTLGCSTMLYRYFERPMTALRERWPVRLPPPVILLAALEAPAIVP